MTYEQPAVEEALAVARIRTLYEEFVEQARIQSRHLPLWRQLELSQPIEILRRLLWPDEGPLPANVVKLHKDHQGFYERVFDSERK